ncbi:MAG TPA: photosynthetic reaction center cytochrome c subunit family protein, partial [Haliangiales bacterium]|nr:photosynthetic reaction center cytochrome c subunit family protein [Haliangiales bacterium]
LTLVACGAAPPAPVAAPAAPAPAPLDLVSALAPNADMAAFAKFDWPRSTAVSPSERVFANVLVMHGMTAERFMIGMLAMRASLGVECKHCHDLKLYPSDELAPKRTARRMMIMAERINREGFAGEARVTCYTCHRGEAKPPAPPEPPAPPAALALTDEQANLAGRKVYKNVTLLAGRRARFLPGIMAGFSAALGVPCSHCHVEGAWDRDDVPAKARAREMMRMTARANGEMFGAVEGIGCFTCHRGSPAPPPTRPEK